MRKCPAGHALLPRMYWKGASYWYVRNNKWQKLGKTYAQALRRYAEIDQPQSQWGDLVAHVYAGMDIAENTRKQYDMIRPRIIKGFQHLHPHEITTRHVAAFLESHADTPNMANRMLSVLRVICEKGARMGAMDYNPTMGVKRFTEKKRTRYITDAELSIVLDNLSPRHRVIAEMAYLTGQRIGDVLSIRTAQVSKDGIYFEQQKTKARLLVGMSPDLAACLAASKALYGDEREYLYHPKGKDAPLSYTAIRDAWRRAVKKSGVEHCTLHDIRAKSLTDAKKQGLNAQALAGHRLESTTARYLRSRETPVVHGPLRRTPNSLEDDS